MIILFIFAPHILEFCIEILIRKNNKRIILFNQSVINNKI
jgi:hypothetical protein